MNSSELSDALNPYANQQRARLQNFQPVFQQDAPVQYMPHRSELEDAIPEQQTPSMTMPQTHIIPRPVRRQPNDASHPVHELIRAYNATREAQEAEIQRRITWEQEQEAKYRETQVAMEQQIHEMRRQITALQSALTQNLALAHQGNVSSNLSAPGMSSNGSPSMNSGQSTTTGLFTPQFSLEPAVTPSHPPQENQSASPLSPNSQNQASYDGPQFVQGASNQHNSSAMARYYSGTAGEEYMSNMPGLPMHQNAPQVQYIPTNSFNPPPNNSSDMHQNYHQQTSVEPQASKQSHLPPRPQSATPSPSPQLSHAESSYSSPSDQRVSKRSKKRAVVEIDGTDSSSDSDSSASNNRIRRVSHHDKRCLTIHHAIRAHFLRMMDIDTDKELPDGHTEGIPLGPDDPIRFVWDKTTKQSVHNARMKNRVLEDVRENRRLYKHVPQKDFSKKVLESVFEQCFVTLRQKFKAQRDARIASNFKKREDMKARKARHVSRRKVKLNNRAESREKIQALEHVTFDGALQVECMSSEDSEYETDASGNRTLVLISHGYAWRSQRLVRFFGILDENIQVKIKRGVGKRDRAVGALKEGFQLPPKGIARWMISKRWITDSQREHPDLPNILSKLVEEPTESEWNHLTVLGEESEEEAEIALPTDLPQMQQQQQLHLHQFHVPQLPHPQQQHHQQHQSPHQQPQPQPAYHMPQNVNHIHVHAHNIPDYNPQSSMLIPQQHYNTGIYSMDYSMPL